MHRFFLPRDCFTRSGVTVAGQLVHRLRNVLRLGAGDCVVFLDNSGWEYEVELGQMSGSKLEGTIISKAPAAGEPQTGITLYQALLKGGNFESVLQKCTEVGVTGYVPIICERCVAAEPTGSRLGRWLATIIQMMSWGTFGIAMYFRWGRNLPAFQGWLTLTAILWALWVLIFITSRYAFWTDDPHH